MARLFRSWPLCSTGSDSTSQAVHFSRNNWKIEDGPRHRGVSSRSHMPASCQEWIEGDDRTQYLGVSRLKFLFSHGTKQKKVPSRSCQCRVWSALFTRGLYVGATQQRGLFAYGPCFCYLCGSAHEQRQLLQLVGTYQGWRGSSPSAPVAHEPVSDERITNALQRVQDHLQETMAISQKRPQRTCTEQAASRTKGKRCLCGSGGSHTGTGNTRAKMSRSIEGWEAVNVRSCSNLRRRKPLKSM